MRFIIQSSVYVVLFAFLLHAIIAIPLPASTVQGSAPSNSTPNPGFLKDTQYAVQENYHKWREGRHLKKAEIAEGNKKYSLEKRRKHQFNPVIGKMYDRDAKYYDYSVCEEKGKQRAHAERSAHFQAKRQGNDPGKA